MTDVGWGRAFYADVLWHGLSIARGLGGDWKVDLQDRYRGRWLHNRWGWMGWVRPGGTEGGWV